MISGLNVETCLQAWRWRFLPWFRRKAQLLLQTCASALAQPHDLVLLWAITWSLFYTDAIFAKICDNVWQGDRQTESDVSTLSGCINLSFLQKKWGEQADLDPETASCRIFVIWLKGCCSNLQSTCYLKLIGWNMSHLTE